MADMAKIIEGLEMSYKYSNVDEHNTLVSQRLVLDAITLLKEQEPKSVLSNRGRRYARKGFCPKCHQEMEWLFNRQYCGFCGQAIKWEVEKCD